MIGTEEQMDKWKKIGLKTQILHHCIELMFKSVTDLGEKCSSFLFLFAFFPELIFKKTFVFFGKSGAKIYDAEKKERKVYPFFCYYIADWPEGQHFSVNSSPKEKSGRKKKKH